MPALLVEFRPFDRRQDVDQLLQVADELLRHLPAAGGCHRPCSHLEETALDLAPV